MSDVELAIKWSKRFERLLSEKYGAEGKGLHQKISASESQLSSDVVKKLRYIATIRNKLVHEENYRRIDNRRAFVQACKYCQRALGKKTPPVLLFVFLLIIIAEIIYLFVLR